VARVRYGAASNRVRVSNLSPIVYAYMNVGYLHEIPTIKQKRMHVKGLNSIYFGTSFVVGCFGCKLCGRTIKRNYVRAPSRTNGKKSRRISVI
jgi:hypothetical protein